MRPAHVLPLALFAMPVGALELGSVAGSTVSFEGLLQGDALWFDEDASDLDGGGDDRASAIRRAELVLEGEAPWGLDWVLGYDAKSERWLDVNLKRGIGPGALQLGQFKQPNSLEELSSTRNNDFVSKAAATNAFAVARRLGVAYRVDHGHWTLAASAFGRDINGGGAQDSGYGLRGTWAPVQEQGRLLHFGISWVDQDTDADRYRLRVRPQADLAVLRLVDTGTLADTDRSAIAGFETLWISGPVKLQGEWFQGAVERHSAPDFAPRGGYLSALWNLGGQTWGYKGGVPGTPLPEAGGSLWQAGLRLDALDLDDGTVRGGTLEALTVGVNWYYGRHLKAMLNYVDVRTERQDVSDDPDLVELRLQLHW